MFPYLGAWLQSTKWLGALNPEEKTVSNTHPSHSPLYLAALRQPGEMKHSMAEGKGKMDILLHKIAKMGQVKSRVMVFKSVLQCIGTPPKINILFSVLGEQWDLM